MTASGSSSFNPAVTDMIAQVFRQLGVIAEGEDPTGTMFEDALFTFNSIVAAAQAIGAHVWTEQEAILFLQPGQVRYEIGGPGTNGNTSDSNDWNLLTIAQAALGGATAIVVASASFVASGDNIGVAMNDGSVFWTTVAGAPSSTSIPLAAPLPAAGTSSGNLAFDYTTAITRPLKVPAARLLYLYGNNEVSMRPVSRQGYMDMPNKLTPGTPTQFFYTPQLDRGILYVWPAPQQAVYAVRFTWYRALQDFFQPTDTMDFPQEWIAPLLWTCARDLMGAYDVPPVRQQYILTQAQRYNDLAVSYDRESEPIEFGMDWTVGR